jgi:hypothetical protein
MYIQNSRPTARVNAVTADPEMSAIADLYGYEDAADLAAPSEPVQDISTEDQVSNTSGLNQQVSNPSFIQHATLSPSSSRMSSCNSTARCNFIHPIPSQILTVFTQDRQVVHIELDSNATVNYIKYDAAKHYGFKIQPNSQLSILADGITKLPAMGEIDEIFHRNDWTVTFKAVVVKSLHTNFIGGTVFLKHNNILQDFVSNKISVHAKYVIPSTSPALILPIQPQNHLCKVSAGQTLWPGQTMSLKTPFPDRDTVAVEPWKDNKMADWPPPQLCPVKAGNIDVTNNTEEPILLGKDVKLLQIRPTVPVPYDGRTPTALIPSKSF